MKLNQILDPNLLRKHIENGFVGYQTHPTLPLTIYNYTHKAAFANIWGDGTIDYCRGLIVDCFDDVIARPFRKFHNLNTVHIAETMEANLPNVAPTITEKMDGSLGIYWTYDGQFGIATRGSFTSPQAKWATEYLHEKWPDRHSLKVFPNATALFEIIYRENRIVVDYPYEDLVLLGIVNFDGTERDRKEVEKVAEFLHFRITERHDPKDLYLVGDEEEKNREGYVLSYDVPGKSPVKVKVKFDEYVKLHRVITGVSPKAIWELLSTGADRSFIDTTPEHFRKWAESWVNKLFKEFQHIYAYASHIYLERPYQWHYIPEKEYRAKCAEYFSNHPYSAICFAMLDQKGKKHIDAMIWKMVKPRGDDQSFRTDGE